MYLKRHMTQKIVYQSLKLFKSFQKKTLFWYTWSDHSQIWSCKVMALLWPQVRGDLLPTGQQITVMVCSVFLQILTQAETYLEPQNPVLTFQYLLSFNIIYFWKHHSENVWVKWQKFCSLAKVLYCVQVVIDNLIILKISYRHQASSFSMTEFI